MRRRRLIIVVVVILLIGLVGWLIRSRAGGQKLGVSAAFATNLGFVQGAANNQVDFFNGANFASYSLSTNTTKALTPLYTLPSISNIRWGSNRAVFYATNYTSVDDLQPILAAKKLDTTAGYWWLADFSTGKLSLIATPAVLAGGQSNPLFNLPNYTTADAVLPANTGDVSVVYLDSNADGTNQVVRLFRADGSVTTVNHQFKSSRLVWADQTHAWVIEGSALINLDFKTNSAVGVTGDVYSEATASSDGQYVAYIKAGKQSAKNVDQFSGDVYIYSARDQKTRRVLTGVNGSLVWDGSNAAVMVVPSSPSGKSVSLNIASYADKPTAWTINKVPHSFGSVVWTWSPSAPSLIYTDEKNTAYRASENPPSSSGVKTSAVITEDAVSQPTFYLVNLRQQDQINIYILQNPYRQNQQAAASFLRERYGLDPNLQKIRWYADDGVNKPPL